MVLEIELSFSDWIARLDELAYDRDIQLPLDIGLFQPQYRAGQTPREALLNYTTGHGTHEKS